ncbi:glycosyltransferase family 39 protein [Calothrix sp. NIES-3974]|uniref:glycosyltransferase family 39 protein n=1 Tax=Calothrix sp. NIES-3974 TaxID=2005462 RepID=UPI000B611C9B|nr:glycosyltransferase family 39 protein [Calothrix sp. NIES-3974]BAZ07520.1 hypothetical protein NIES3974_41840 [Calothrix sp. NIES-3974]
MASQQTSPLHPYHYLGLTGILILGLLLRLWNLDLKPLWLDEVITAIFSLGKNYHLLSLNQVISITQVQEIFTYQPTSCRQITQNLISQSTHPPLFFCAMHRWMGWLQLAGINWVMGLRLLPAIFGVSAIASTYVLTRLAFSPTTGLIAAMVMAVSPFGVYLSQEARHYTLPILMITLALIAQIRIQQDALIRGKPRWWLWCSWILVSSLGLYTHYFMILVVIAQIVTHLGFISKHRQQISHLKTNLIGLGISIIVITCSYIPWLTNLLTHSKASETDWLSQPQHIAPIYHTILNWLLMIIALPVEHQPLLVTIPSAITMLVFGLWFGNFFPTRLRQLLKSQKTNTITFTFIGITGCLILEILIISYVFQKDITSVPRYSFIWYPSAIILIAATLDKKILKHQLNQSENSNREKYLQNSPKKTFKNLQNYLNPSPNTTLLIIITLSITSSILVNHNLVFQKPFLPEKTATNLFLEQSKPTLIIMGYHNYQDIALGLSFALATPPKYQNYTKFALLQQSTDFSQFWQNLAQLETIKTPHINLWVFAPGRRRRDYPTQIITTDTKNLCNIDQNHHYRIGIPYQLYRC